MPVRTPFMLGELADPPEDPVDDPIEVEDRILSLQDKGDDDFIRTSSSAVRGRG